ncbi:MAG: hypothetical protein J6L83_01905 [Clostridia bacterium]|nr:hypothetical protein [Clostridia bacterium]
MKRREFNLYLFSVDRYGDLRAVASTDGREGEDITHLLGLPLCEQEFVSRVLLEDVAYPILTRGECRGRFVPVLIERGAIFESSMCLALELCDADIKDIDVLLERGLGRVMMSDETELILESRDCGVTRGTDDLDLACAVRDVLVFGDAVSGGGMNNIEVIDEVLHCIGALAGIDVSFEIADARIDPSERGAVFAGGFCAYALLAHAVIARSLGVRSMAVSVSIDSSCPAVNVSYSVGKWNGKGIGDGLFCVAQALGIPFESRIENRQMHCKMIPELPDEALRGVKEELFSALTEDRFCELE